MYRPAAIDCYARTGNEAGCFARQKYYQPAKFCGVAPAPKWNLGYEQTIDVRIFRECAVHLGMERAR